MDASEQPLCPGRSPAGNFLLFRTFKHLAMLFDRINFGTGDDCWVWNGPRNEQGYGICANLVHESVHTHRHMWAITFGPIPDGKNVLHRCDNPSCVRPDHLFLGTQKENVADCIAKGRRDTHAHNVKLSLAEVKEIKYTPGTRGSGVALAKRFSVSTSTISAIRRGDKWPHV